MNFDDPFAGYSFLLRTILYVGVPAFALWQLVRLRRALHVLQLEGYKRRRFLDWCRAHPRRALFLTRATHKRPLVMTGRAWRILIVATALSVLVVLGASAAAHLAAGWPLDIPTWALATVLTFVGAPVVLVAADGVLTPVQAAINARYLRAARRKLETIAPTVVGVTGSFGKTSTKFAIEQVLASKHHVLATPGSYNTPLGVCRTINERLERAHDFFIVEMGAYKRGEIAELCAFVRPDISVLTAVGPAHLERFGSLDAIRRAKYEVVEALPAEGVAVLNVDDPEVRALADATQNVRVIRYGVVPEGRPDVTAVDLATTSRGAALTVVDHETDESTRAQTRLLGRHAVGHVLAACAVAKAAGLRISGLTAALEDLRPVDHRLQLLDGTGDVTVIDDAYNSNPDGAAAALEVLDEFPGRPKIVVTPGMIELGELQAQANERFGEHAARVADVVIFVANVNRDALVAGARRATGGEIVTVDSLEHARRELERVMRPGAVVLFENDLPDQYEG